VIAGALTIVGSGLCWRRDGVVFPNSPGDSVLVVIVASVASFCGAFFLFLAIFFTFGDDDWFPAFYLIVGLIAFIAWLYIHDIIIRRHVDTVAWRCVFLALMVSPLTISILFWPTVAAFIACVLWAAWSDWRKNIDRDWTHWCGVGFAISLGISPAFRVWILKSRSVLSKILAWEENQP
jgi:hypothetical protein